MHEEEELLQFGTYDLLCDNLLVMNPQKLAKRDMKRRNKRLKLKYETELGNQMKIHTCLRILNISRKNPPTKSLCQMLVIAKKIARTLGKKSMG